MNSSIEEVEIEKKFHPTCANSHGGQLLCLPGC